MLKCGVKKEKSLNKIITSLLVKVFGGSDGNTWKSKLKSIGSPEYKKKKTTYLNL